MYCRAMPRSIEGQRQVLDPMRVGLCVPVSLGSIFVALAQLSPSLFPFPFVTQY